MLYKVMWVIEGETIISADDVMASKAKFEAMVPEKLQDLVLMGSECKVRFITPSEHPKAI